MQSSEQPGGAAPARRRIVRNLVTRSDGKLVNVGQKTGQLFVCAAGCCCGHTDRGFAPVQTELFHEEWERRRLRPHVHLSIGGCLGPCPLANVVMLLFDGRAIWFHSFNSERLVYALFDYIELMRAAQAYLPPPPELADLQFSTFAWGEGATLRQLAPRETGAGDGAHMPPTSDPESATPNPRAPTAHLAATGGFVFLTHADTDLLALSKVVPHLGPDFPPVRGHGIAHFRSDDDARAFVDAVVPGADVVILRLLGGRASFRGGFERAVERAREDEQWLICLPGTDALDPELTAASNVGAAVAHEALAYLQFGGLRNVEQLLRFLSDHLLTTGFGYDSPVPQPRHGVYWDTSAGGERSGEAIDVVGT